MMGLPLRATKPSMACFVWIAAAVWTWAPALGQDGAAPAGMRGKSVIVTWTENRMQRAVGEQVTRHVGVNLDWRVYVSSAGRPFSRLSATAMRPRGATRTGSAEHVGSVGQSTSGGARAVQFQGRSLINTATMQGMARRIQVDFDDRFASCTARVVVARQVGAQKAIAKSVISKREFEVISATAGAATCAVRSGNVFGS
jgi:hypothetical protein